MKIKTAAALFLPPLYAVTAKGKIQKWRAWAQDGIVRTEFGQVGGKQQVTVGRDCWTTNSGRSNERTPEALGKKRLKRKYRRSPEEARSPIFLPMLAQDYWKRERGKAPVLSSVAKKLELPVYAQRKLNGVRCIAMWKGDQVVLLSRGGETWAVTHIVEEVSRFLDKGLALDGEIYIHGVPLQQLSSLAKDYREESKALEYHVYDTISLGAPETSQTERLHLREDFFARLSGWGPHLKKVPTREVRRVEEFAELEQRYVGEGYEGLIIRVQEAPYRWNMRSPSLLKFKSFQDAEFVVVGCREGRGKFAGCAIFVCKNDHPVLSGGSLCAHFKCAAPGNMAERRNLWKHHLIFIGKKLTVRFFERSRDGVPLQPVGIAFRDEKDLPK